MAFKMDHRNCSQRLFDSSCKGSSCSVSFQITYLKKLEILKIEVSLYGKLAHMPALWIISVTHNFFNVYQWNILPYKWKILSWMYKDQIFFHLENNFQC